jgi:2-methylcitrate dehydratase PrpD
LFGRAGEAEFDDALVVRRDVTALRDRIHAAVDPAIAEDAADVRVTLNDGRTLHVFVAHAIGSVGRPMSDTDLSRKFHGLVDPVLGGERAEKLVALLRDIGEAPNVHDVVATAAAT